MISRRKLVALPALGALPLPAAFAQAQDYPNKPVRIIVPIAAGTASDGAARYIANALSKAFNNNPFVVENRVGADGTIATDFVAKSPADGYTLLSTFSIHYIHQWMQTVPYDAVRDFEPVVRFGRSAVVLVVSADSPYKSLRDLIEAARQKPGQLAYASAASTSTMAAALMENMSGVKLRMVPYKSSPQSVIDTASGQVDLTFAGVAASMPLIRSGRVRALAATTAMRTAGLPDVPTMAEAGLAGYEFSAPNWIMAPRGVPPAILNKLSDTLVRIVSAQEFKDFAKNTGFEVDVQDGATARAGAAAELARWKRLVEISNVKAS